MCYGGVGANESNHGHSKRRISGMAGTACKYRREIPRVRGTVPALPLSATNVCTDPRELRHSGDVSRRTVVPALLTARNRQLTGIDGSRELRRRG
jgi:hypothetical protein